MRADTISPCRNAGMATLCESCRRADASQTEGTAVGWRVSTKQKRARCMGFQPAGNLRGEG